MPSVSGYDVIVEGKSLEEHNANLRKVLNRLREAGLKLKPKKCKFAQIVVEYLGHIVSEKGVRTDPKKLQAVRNFPCPENVKTRFIPAFAKLPLLFTR